MAIYKTVKLPIEAYKEAIKLENELEKKKVIEGVHRVTISTAISYALTKTLQTVKGQDVFKSAAGGWAGLLDTDAFLKKIYKAREKVSRQRVDF